MNFLKYPSLTNHYAIGKEKRILAQLEEAYYSTEKIHGANVSIVLDQTGNVDFAKRSGFIEADDKQFNRFVQLAKNKQQLIHELESFLDWQGVTQVHAFGEYFGSKVQNMDYDLNKNQEVAIKIFNVILEYENGVIHYVVSRGEVEKYISHPYLTPTEEISTLRHFLKEDPTEDSIYGGYSEGLVYQPLHGYILDDSFRFLGVKHKTDKFNEVSNNPINPKPKTEHTLEFMNLVSDVSRYITVNRLTNVLSHGDIELITKNIGKLMIALKEDVVTEYMRETDTQFSESDVLSALRACDKDIAKMIKEAIQLESLEVIV